MKTEQYKFIEVAERPEWGDIPDGVVYYVKQYNGLAFKCPCGCNTPVYLGISETVASHPHLWYFDGVDTITPSILHTEGCKSHYFIKQGKVIWT